jgi:galactosamine-6-phosphate isomerase
MNIVVKDSFEDMSRAAAEDFLKIAGSMTSPLVCLPSGNTPIHFCRFLVEHYKATGTTPDWDFIGLDEWVGVPSSVKGSCRYFFDEHLFGPLGIPEHRISFFNGMAADIKAEQKKAEEVIAVHGGLDIAVLGIGANGHLGFNEPGSDVNLKTQVIGLEAVTLKSGESYFAGPRSMPTQGITLGLATLLSTKHVLVIANGAHKTSVVEKMVKGPKTNALPASLLQDHPACTLYLDTAASGNLH